MKRILAAAAVAAFAGVAAPAHADVTVCLGGVTVVAAGQTVVDQQFDCVVVDTP